jgi:hypothetical protein
MHDGLLLPWLSRNAMMAIKVEANPDLLFRKDGEPYSCHGLFVVHGSDGHHSRS